MVPPRFWKPNVLVCLLPVLLLALTGVSAQAQPTAGKTSDPKAYDAQLRRIGNYKFENFETIPLFDVYIEVVVDPKIVADWPFSGWDGGDIGHTWLIKACRDQKPCK